MIVTKSNARRIIASVYGPEFKFRITRSRNWGMHPLNDTRPTLIWQALARGSDSAVKIGVLDPMQGVVNWNADIA